MTSNDDYVLECLKEEMVIKDSEMEIAVEYKLEKNAKGKEAITAVDALIEKGILTCDEILAVLCSRFGLSMIELNDEIVIKSKSYKLVRSDIAIKYKIFPIKEENNVLTIAIGDPLEVDVLDSLRYILKCEIEAVVANPKSIRDAIGFCYGHFTESEFDNNERYVEKDEKDEKGEIEPFIIRNYMGEGMNLEIDGKDATLIIENVIDRACGNKFLKDLFMDKKIDIIDYIRSLYPEYYSSLKEKNKEKNKEDIIVDAITRIGLTRPICPKESLKVPKKNIAASLSNCKTKDIDKWTYLVFLELVGENKPFRNSNHVFSEINYKLLDECWEKGMTQYEAAIEITREISNSMKAKEAFGITDVSFIKQKLKEAMDLLEMSIKIKDHDTDVRFQFNYEGLLINYEGLLKEVKEIK